MTGFGVATLELDDMSVAIEVRSINSKSQDFGLRLPKKYLDKEFEVKNLIAQILERGKVNLQVDVLGKGKLKPKISINSEIFKAYAEDLKKNVLDNQLNDAHILNAILSLPEVFETEKSENSEDSSWNLIFEAIKIAIVNCDNFRKDEGAKLQEHILGCLSIIKDRLTKISTIDSERNVRIKEKIKSKLEEFMPSDKVDANRLEQELIYYIEKLDISEEKVRLQTHLDYFIETMNLPDSNGKKLGFIAQEIGREINTIGSKANDANIQKWVVEMKDELEKIKEQSMNVL